VIFDPFAQAPPGYWLGYLTPLEEETAHEVVLPSHVVEVLPITEQASADWPPSWIFFINKQKPIDDIFLKTGCFLEYYK